METVAFPKERDIATKPILVQMVTLCQIALDPHLCLIGYDGNGGIPKERVTSQLKPISCTWSHFVKLHSILICVSLATMETVAFPKESDIAAKPGLVQMVPLCQMALDPHLCLTGNDGNGGISKREGHRSQNPVSFKWSHSVKFRSIHICVSLATMEMVAFQKKSDITAKPSLVQMVTLCQIALDPHLCLIGKDGNGGISKRERVTSQLKPISCTWSHFVKLHSILVCVSLATMETVAFPKESDIAAKPGLVQMVPLCQIALDPHLCLNGKDGKRWHSEKRVTSQPTPISFKWSHSVKLHSILICVSLATMETVAFRKESDIAAKVSFK